MGNHRKQGTWFHESEVFLDWLQLKGYDRPETIAEIEDMTAEFIRECLEMSPPKIEGENQEKK